MWRVCRYAKMDWRGRREDELLLIGRQSGDCTWWSVNCGSGLDETPFCLGPSEFLLRLITAFAFVSATATSGRW